MFTTRESGFDTVDYVVFFILCIGSCAGGLWYSALGSRKKAVLDITDYLLGGKMMKTFPVAMSLIASYVSGLTILGTPAEVYNYGTQYWLVIIGVTLSCGVVAYFYLPVYFTLRISSSYQYLELRFNRHVRAVASVLFLLDEILFLPIVVFVPALAFNQLTGVSVFIVGGIMVIICGLYTVLGGLKAVVWTDSVQTAIMFLGTVVVSIVATISVGGPGNLMQVADRSGRLKLDNWNFSPYERQTGWGAMFGGFIYWTCFNAVNQTMVQRYLALPTKMKAIGALSIFCSGAALAISLCVWCGLAAWAAWAEGGCHEDGTPAVNDRMLPAFVIYLSRKENLPGVPGVFMAGLFGAGLSSLSAVLNACALVAIEDIMRGWLRIELKPFIEGLLARFATAVLAVISVIMLIFVEKLGGILGVALALSSIAASTTCGVFSLGIFCWWVGPTGATAGALAGGIMTLTVSLGIQYASAAGLKSPPMDFSNACPNMNITSDATPFDPTTVFPLFRISFHWVAPLGLFTTLFVGAIVGLIFDKKYLKMDAELYTPAVWRCLPKAAHEHAGECRKAQELKNEARRERHLSMIAPPLIPVIIEPGSSSWWSNFPNILSSQDYDMISRSKELDELAVDVDADSSKSQSRSLKISSSKSLT